MLQITQINPTGMFSFAKSETITFPQNGLVHLLGQNEDKGNSSNGSGKTSLFNAVCELLYGDNPSGVSGAGVINNVWDHGYCGRIEFVSWEGIYYRVTYCRDWKLVPYEDGELYSIDNNTQSPYRGTDLFLDAWNGEAWIDKRGASMKATRDAIVEAVGLSYSRFLAISYMSHRVGMKFLRGTNKERDDVLSGITGVEKWDIITTKCRSEVRHIEAEIADLSGKQFQHKGALEVLRGSYIPLSQFNWQGYTRDQKAIVKNVEGEICSLATNIDKLSILLLELESKKLSENPIVNNLDYHIQEFNTKITSLLREKIEVGDFGIQELQKKSIEYYSEVSKAKGALNSLGNDVDLLHMEVCPTCDSKITKAKKDKIKSKVVGFKEIISKYETLKAEVDYNIVISSMAKEEKLKEFVLARDAEISKINKMIAGLKEQKSIFMVDNQKLVEDLNNVKGDIQEIRAKIRDKEFAVKSAKEEISRSENKMDEVNKLMFRIQEEENTLALLDEQVQGKNQEMSIHKWFIQNIPYIKLHKLSVSNLVLTEQVNKYLSEMGSTLRINISSFSEKKNKKNAADLSEMLKSEIKVEVTDGIKNIDPRLYSDGESGALAGALIRALHDLAIQFGHGCNLKMLDEVFSFLDHDNSQRLAESLSLNVNGTTIITDNSGRASGLMNFDHVWTAKKRNGLTTLEVN